MKTDVEKGAKRNSASSDENATAVANQPRRKHVYILEKRVGEYETEEMLKMKLPVAAQTIEETAGHAEMIGTQELVSIFTSSIMQELWAAYPGRNFYHRRSARETVHFFERLTMADMRPPNIMKRALGKRAKLVYVDTLVATMECRRNGEGRRSFCVDLDITERSFYEATIESVRELGVRLTNGRQTLALKTTLDCRVV